MALDGFTLPTFRTTKYIYPESYVVESVRAAAFALDGVEPTVPTMTCDSTFNVTSAYKNLQAYLHCHVWRRQYCNLENTEPDDITDEENEMILTLQEKLINSDTLRDLAIADLSLMFDTRIEVKFIIGILVEYIYRDLSDAKGLEAATDRIASYYQPWE